MDYFDCFIGVGGFGRRASDGGAYLQMYGIDSADQQMMSGAGNSHPVSMGFFVVVGGFLE